MQIADRLGKIPPYLFMTLRNKINEARAAGIDVISLAIGDPVEATPANVVEALAAAARDKSNHCYPTDEEWGMRAFRDAVARWYARRYNVTLDPAREICALIGSKEGCHHFALGVINPGDTVLVTDPGYPGYKPSIWFVGAEPYPLPMCVENDFLPDLSAIPSDVAKKATAFYLNYPNNPTGAVATPEFLNDLVAFAKEYSIAICYDNPYSEVVFGVNRLSFLNAPGAKEVGVELNSLSKP
ncbi:MAG TPA: aminotransferase class I/II-fold pyridoxal phosphate-dependent enzyme, partial [Candidatus Hydrogenedentes bacterium]|nr:aminotransferase class I/II-fold pyridoxal phosphate-dependent enzyme [Candidatus Hydrogenedentota bacterium]